MLSPSPRRISSTALWPWWSRAAGSSILHAADETGPSSLELLKRLEASGAVVTLFTNDPALAEGRERAFLLPRSESVLSPFAFTAAIQLFACFLAQRKGLDPDQSRNLNKYTVTM